MQKCKEYLRKRKGMNRMKRLIIAENNIRVTREVELEECARIFEGAVKRLDKM